MRGPVGGRVRRLRLASSAQPGARALGALRTARRLARQPSGVSQLHLHRRDRLFATSLPTFKKGIGWIEYRCHP